jgi:DNA-binding transcriptional ArsR family regulator
MKDLEKILKALANRRRLSIIKYLKNNGEASVGDIAEAIKLSFRSTSKHLGILAAVDIIEREQRSLQMFYRLSQTQKSATTRIIALI